MLFDFPEIVIIFGVALVVLGPKKLPGAAAQIGRWVGRARAMARQFREQLEQEVNSVESALDTNPKHQQTIKPPSSPTRVTPETPEPPGALEAPAGAMEAPLGAMEAPAVDPAEWAAPGIGWYPGEAGSEGFLAPYGDPNAIPPPEPERAEGQLSLQLDVPPVAPPAPPPSAESPPPAEPHTTVPAGHAAAEQGEGR